MAQNEQVAFSPEGYGEWTPIVEEAFNAVSGKINSSFLTDDVISLGLPKSEQTVEPVLMGLEYLGLAAGNPVAIKTGQKIFGMLTKVPNDHEGVPSREITARAALGAGKNLLEKSRKGGKIGAGSEAVLSDMGIYISDGFSGIYTNPGEEIANIFFNHILSGSCDETVSKFMIPATIMSRYKLNDGRCVGIGASLHRMIHMDNCKAVSYIIDGVQDFVDETIVQIGELETDARKKQGAYKGSLVQLKKNLEQAKIEMEKKHAYFMDEHPEAENPGDKPGKNKVQQWEKKRKEKEIALKTKYGGQKDAEVLISQGMKEWDEIPSNMNPVDYWQIRKDHFENRTAERRRAEREFDQSSSSAENQYKMEMRRTKTEYADFVRQMHFQRDLISECMTMGMITTTHIADYASRRFGLENSDAKKLTGYVMQLLSESMKNGGYHRANEVLMGLCETIDAIDMEHSRMQTMSTGELIALSKLNQSEQNKRMAIYGAAQNLEGLMTLVHEYSNLGIGRRFHSASSDVLKRYADSATFE